MNRGIILDTNILIRAVFGKKVGAILDRYYEDVDFFTPELCYHELNKHAYRIAESRNIQQAAIAEAIERLEKIVRSVSTDIYQPKEQDAKARIAERDVNDWPIVALALVLNCPIWTEDQDFFGTGVSTWHSRNVEIFLSNR